MRDLIAVARVWRLQWLVAAIATSAALLRCHPRPLDVPGRSGGVEWVLSPVIPTAVAALLPPVVRRAHMPLERTSTVFQMAGRLVVSVTAWMACTAPVAIGVGGLRVVDLRNGALVTGVALASVVSLPAAMAWAPPVLLGVVTWLIGVPPPGAPPPGWAVLLAPRPSIPALVSSALALLVGTGVFATRVVGDDSVEMT